METGVGSVQITLNPERLGFPVAVARLNLRLAPYPVNLRPQPIQRPPRRRSHPASHLRRARGEADRSERLSAAGPIAHIESPGGEPPPLPVASA